MQMVESKSLGGKRMKFNLTFTYDKEEALEKVPDKVLVEERRFSSIYEIEVNSLEDILRLTKVDPNGVVIYEADGYDGEHDYTIEIYNGYRE